MLKKTIESASLDMPQGGRFNGGNSTYADLYRKNLYNRDESKKQAPTTPVVSVTVPSTPVVSVPVESVPVESVTADTNPKQEFGQQILYLTDSVYEARGVVKEDGLISMYNKIMSMWTYLKIFRSARHAVHDLVMNDPDSLNRGSFFLTLLQGDISKSLDGSASQPIPTYSSDDRQRIYIGGPETVTAVRGCIEVAFKPDKPCKVKDILQCSNPNIQKMPATKYVFSITCHLGNKDGWPVSHALRGLGFKEHSPWNKATSVSLTASLWLAHNIDAVREISGSSREPMLIIRKPTLTIQQPFEAILKL